MPEAVERGEAQAAEDLLPVVYQQLRRLAAWRMSHERAGQTLQPTALVHEAWLRLQGEPGHRWECQRHFFAAAAEAMRRILIDRARQKRAVRRGGGLHRTEVDLENLPLATEAPDEELLAVHEALDALAAHDPRKAELVKLRYFAGLSLEEAASCLGISPVTARRYWAVARAWLFAALADAEPTDPVEKKSPPG